MVWKALYMAMRYIPDDKKDEIRRIVCEGCKYNDGEEQLACCWCQEGSLFENDENQKLTRGNRSRLPIIEDSYINDDLDNWLNDF